MKAVLTHLSSTLSQCAVPLYLDPVKAGFPSPARDYIDQPLDFNALMIRRPASTFALRAEGESMVDIGIGNGDILVVDRAIEARHGHIVIAAVDGEFVVKQLETRPQLRLMSMSRNYPDIVLREGQELNVFGVVTYCVKQLAEG